MTKEELWLIERAGKITSSNLTKLFTGGSRPATAEELIIYKLVKSAKKTTPLEFGETAINYLYQIQREKRLKAPTYQRDIYNFTFGKDAEKYAVMWLRANRPDLIIKYCNSDDFDSIPFCSAPSGVYDSPDAFANEDIVIEIKCPVDKAKFEQIRDMSKEEVMGEYDLQFANHLNCNPTCHKLLYVIYDSQVDDDPYDLLDPLHPDRGVIFEYDRSEFAYLILSIEDKVKHVMKFLALVDEGKMKVRDINNWKPSNPIDGFILPQIEMSNGMKQQITEGELKP